jgi:hypothetical protein
MFIQRICISSRVRADWLPPGGPSGLHENLEFRGFRPVQLLFSLLAVTPPRVASMADAQLAYSLPLTYSLAR